MNTDRATFISGMVLGVAIGLVAGHYFFWNASIPATTRSELSVVGQDVAANQSEVSSKKSDPFAAYLGERSAITPSMSDSFYGDDHEGIDEESEDSPLKNAIAVERPASDDKPTIEQEPAPVTSIPEEITTESAQRPSEPKRLHISHAAPLSSRIAKVSEVVRTLIDQELGDLPPEQKEVWYESLKEESRENAEGILRMWKMFGTSPSDDMKLNVLVPDPEDPESFLTPPSQPVPDHFTADDFGSRSVVTEQATSKEDSPYLQAAQILRRNLLRAHQPGALLLQVQIQELSSGVDGETTFEVSSSPAVLAHASRIDQTACDLDLAIEGAGWFIVADEEGNQFYTYYGQFSLDQERRLVREAGGKTLVLQPEIRLPEVFDEIEISHQGEVVAVTTSDEGERTSEALGRIQVARFLTFRHLQDAGNGLVSIPDENKNEVLVTYPGNDKTGNLLQRHLESSVIDINRVEAQIEWFLGQKP